MTPKEYVDTLKSKSQELTPVAMRGALVYYLHKQNISFSIIASCMGKTRRWAYYRYYQIQDLLEVGDKYAKAAVDEVDLHNISIRPYTVTGNIFTQLAGYKLIIDNIIF